MKKQIALVDDSTPFCLLVQQIFNEQCEVDTFNTGAEFLTGLNRAAKYDLVLLDINMPDMSGLSILQTLKENETTRSVPVLMLTGDARKNTVLQGKTLGAVDFVVKPIDPLQLEERVAALLSAGG